MVPRTEEHALQMESDEECPSSQARPTAYPWRRVSLVLAASVAVVGTVAFAQRLAVPPARLVGSFSRHGAEENAMSLVAEQITIEHEKRQAKGKTASAAPTTPACKHGHADDTPSLFCWAVMYDSDVALITSQFTGRAGIFACNDYAVIAKEEKLIGKDDCGNDFKSWQENLPTVEKGIYGVNAMTSSWLNVPVFILCWDRLLSSGKVWESDFTVKVDPDAVFFPDRLGAVLAQHVGSPIFTTNCRFWGGDQVGKLFGAIEVLSKNAIGAYKGNEDTCKNLPWQGWGEDYWMQHCMDALGIPAVGMFDEVSDGTCPLGGYAPCSQNKVVIHPKKDAGEWWECWKQSTNELVAKT